MIAGEQVKRTAGVIIIAMAGGIVLGVAFASVLQLGAALGELRCHVASHAETQP